MNLFFESSSDFKANQQVKAANIPFLSSSATIDENTFILIYENSLFSLKPMNKTLGGQLNCCFDDNNTQKLITSINIKSPLIKATGCKSGFRPKVLDISAGFARDALMLASMGCHVDLVEKNPIIFLLLSSALSAACDSANPLIKDSIYRLCLLKQQSAQCYLTDIDSDYDVIYFDPMFPPRKKQAKVKKTMQFFHHIVGEDDNNPEVLFKLALDKAGKRFVIKRPLLAPKYAGFTPNYSVKTKTTRFDIYLK